MGVERHVGCPSCGTVLGLPSVLRQHVVRCGQCRTVFRVAATQLEVDEQVLGWLKTEDVELEEHPAAKTAAPIESDFMVSHGEGLSQADASRTSSPVDVGGGQVRLVKVEARGALFEFAPKRLREDAFRCAIPRVCIHCLARAHLTAHLVIFTGQLRDSISMEAEHKAGHQSIPQEQLRQLKGAELLAQLPQVPNVPAPANLPMPYWVCDLCNGAGAIGGQIQVNNATGEGFCRLAVRNLKIGLKFFENVGGTGTPVHARFQEFLRHFEADRWDALPSVVGHRVEQWFRAEDGERFLGYIDDLSRRRSERGMAGLVVTDRRLIYHRPPRHHQIERGSSLSVQVRMASGKEIATIDAPDFKRRSISLDRRGIRRFRRCLSEGGFGAVWT